jgi:hypothetical protein
LQLKASGLSVRFFLLSQGFIKKSPGNSAGTFKLTVVQLGSAALSDVVVFFVLALSALFLLILLTGLLAALLATLTGLAALLAALTGLPALLSRLSALATLLFVFLHIVCHEIVLPLNAHLGAQVKSTAFI